MSDSELYQVRSFEPLTVVHCIGFGLRAKFRGFNGEPDHTCPVAAMAVCRVRCDWFSNGRLVRRGTVERELCGVITYHDEGFAFCEGISNFLGYIQPGETAE